MTQPIDTNALLLELRGLFAIPNPQPNQRMRMAELFDTLDTQLSNGGRMPDDWADAVRPLAFPQGRHLCPTCHNAHALPLCKPEDDERCSHGSS